MRWTCERDVRDGGVVGDAERWRCEKDVRDWRGVRDAGDGDVRAM